MKKHVDKLPLKSRIFYIDIKNHQNRSKLRTYVAKLGGTVCEFFDVRVKYLITDRHQKEWILKEKSLNANQEPQTPETPIKKLSDLLPRGKQLALRASSQPSNNTNTNATQPATDVIGLAIKRGIKILEAQSVLDFCIAQISELENPSNCDTATSRAHYTPAPPKPATLKHFKGAFIKVEDPEERYRPSAKEFAEWPKIYQESDPYVCPFIPPSKVKRLSENGEANMIRTNETGGLNGNTKTNTFTNTNNFNISCKISPGTGGTRGNTKISTLAFEGACTPRVSTQRTNDSKCNGPTPVRKQDNEQYCEICNIQFKNVINHIYSSAHQSQLKLKDNYKNLFSVIRSLPKWEGVLDDSEDTQNQADDSPISTPGSNVNGSFLPLHDYIANNNKNNSLKVNYKNDSSITSAFKMRKINILGNFNNNNNNNNNNNTINNHNHNHISNINNIVNGTSNVTVNLSVHNSKNNHSFKIANLIYNNNDRIKERKFVGTKLVDKFNFDQLFSDDDEDVNTDEIAASCFTPPLLPPLLYPELGEDNFNLTDVDYDYDNQLEPSSEKDFSLEF